MIFKGLVVDMRMESATFGCATVDSVEESLGADRKMMAVDVEMVAAGVKMVAADRKMVAADRKMVAAGVAAIPIRIKTTIAVMGLASITAIIMGLLSASPTGGGIGMAAGGGRMRGGAYLQPSLYITLLAPLVSCSASGCSAIKLSMWRMRFSSSISSMAIRMPVSSTSPNP